MGNDDRASTGGKLPDEWRGRRAVRAGRAGICGSRQDGMEPMTTADWRRVRGRAPGLEGLSGRIALEVGDAPAGALQINDAGAVSVVPDADGAAATIIVNSEETLAGLLRGELPPIVMELQGRARIAGDARFALNALYGLQAGSPWAAGETGRS